MVRTKLLDFLENHNPKHNSPLLSVTLVDFSDGVSGSNSNRFPLFLVKRTPPVRRINFVFVFVRSIVFEEMTVLAKGKI
jgi:hypothetical protein